MPWALGRLSAAGTAAGPALRRGVPSQGPKLAAMAAADDPPDTEGEPPGGPDAPGAPDAADAADALREAVARTLTATAEGAVETRERAAELLDEVVRRGVAAREEVSRRGAAAREEVGRRRDAAREEVTRRRDAARDEVSRRGEEAGARLAEALAELRPAEGSGEGPLSERIRALETRLGSLERILRREFEPGSGESPGRTPSKANSNPQAEGEETAPEANEQAKTGEVAADADEAGG